MANRSAAHSPPLSGFSAVRCAVMSQQLLPSNQFGPSSGGAMTAGLRVCTVTGATSSSMVAGISGGDGFGIATPMVWTRSVGTVADLSSATSSQTMPACPGPNFVVGACVADDAGPVAELVAGQGEQRLVACAHRHRRQRHLLCQRVRQLQLVREMGLAVGGRHRHRRGDHAWRSPASRPPVHQGGELAVVDGSIASSALRSRSTTSTTRRSG